MHPPLLVNGGAIYRDSIVKDGRHEHKMTLWLSPRISRARLTTLLRSITARVRHATRGMGWQLTASQEHDGIYSFGRVIASLPVGADLRADADRAHEILESAACRALKHAAQRRRRRKS